jgi:hypothetical protein
MTPRPRKPPGFSRGVDVKGPNGAELARKAPYTHTLTYDKVHGRRSAEEVAGTAP